MQIEKSKRLFRLGGNLDTSMAEMAFLPVLSLHLWLGFQKAWVSSGHSTGSSSQIVIF